MEVLALLANPQLSATFNQFHHQLANLDSDEKPQQPAKRIQRQVRLSPVEVSDLLVAYTEGTSVMKLAEQYGIHRHTVETHLERNGIPRRQCVRALTDEDVAQAAQYYESGESFATIGKRFDVAARTIGRELHRAGVHIRARPGSS